MSINKNKALLVTLSSYTFDARVKTYAHYLKKNGYKVFIVSAKDEAQGSDVIAEDIVNIRVINKFRGSSLALYFLYYFKFFLVSLFAISRLSLRNRFQFIHYNNAPNFIIFACILPKLMGAKIILDNHDLVTSLFASKFEGRRMGGFFMRLLNIEQKLSMAFAHHVITADHNQKDALVEAGIPEDKITVILNVANEAWFRPNPAARNDNEFRLIYHGTVAERLGLDVAIRAVAIARERIPGIRFHLIGQGDFLDNCLKLIDELKLEGVVLPSKCFYPVEKLSDIINTMDVGLVPNRRTRATDEYMLPVKLLEYVYMKLPVIAPRLKIIERYFDDDMLMFFEPGDHEDLARRIFEIYEDKNLRSTLVSNSQKFVKKHNWTAQMERYFRLVDER